MSNPEKAPRIGIIMGSDSDLNVMQHVGRALLAVGLEEQADFEWGVKSAHRTPMRMAEYAHTAQERGLHIIIAGAGGSAHLPGMVASETALPVIGVAITDSPDVMNRALGSMIGMPEGKPLATMQGKAGAFNAGLYAARMLAVHDPVLRQGYEAYEQGLVETVIEKDNQLGELGAQRYMDLRERQG